MEKKTYQKPEMIQEEIKLQDVILDSSLTDGGQGGDVGSDPFGERFK